MFDLQHLVVPLAAAVRQLVFRHSFSQFDLELVLGTLSQVLPLAVKNVFTVYLALLAVRAMDL